MGTMTAIKDADCPHCNQPLYLYNDWSANAEYPSMFTMTCPHCGAALAVTVEATPVFTAKVAKSS